MTFNMRRNVSQLLALCQMACVLLATAALAIFAYFAFNYTSFDEYPPGYLVAKDQAGGRQFIVTSPGKAVTVDVGTFPRDESSGKALAVFESWDIAISGSDKKSFVSGRDNQRVAPLTFIK